jgi:hypothetical protein
VKSDRLFVALNLSVVKTVATFQLACLFLRISFVIMQTDTNKIFQSHRFERAVPLKVDKRYQALFISSMKI